MRTKEPFREAATLGAGLIQARQVDTRKTMSERTDIDVKKLKSRMQARRRDLLGLGVVDHECLKPLDFDQSASGHLSLTDALQSRSLEAEFDRRRHRELQRIEAALRRIADGEYGYCVVCGQEIAAKRIENDPTTSVCINCANEMHTNR